jgi:hypothetical protein
VNWEQGIFAHKYFSVSMLCITPKGCGTTGKPEDAKQQTIGSKVQ